MHPHVKGKMWCRARFADRVDEFECILCLKMLYQPVTTPCGHTFCRDCFLRAGDHSNKCPMCRTVRPHSALSIAPESSIPFPPLTKPLPLLPKQRPTQDQFLKDNFAMLRAKASGTLYCIYLLFRSAGQTPGMASLGFDDDDGTRTPHVQLNLCHDLLGSESEPLLCLAGAACG